MRLFVTRNFDIRKSMLKIVPVGYVARAARGDLMTLLHRPGPGRTEAAHGIGVSMTRSRLVARFGGDIT
jgi:hypothetical protein